MVIANLIKEIEKRIKSRYEAYILIEHVTGFNKSYLISHDIDFNKNDIEHIMKCVELRESGIPLQYITNTQYFYGNKFYVDENVLIPRADTEILIEKCIENAVDMRSLKVLDMCTGSGCIAISLKKELPFAEVYASDLSERALNVAKRNAENNFAEIKFIKSDLFANITDDNFDFIVSNPPYIESDEICKLSFDVKMEPKMALDGGSDGLYFYRKICEGSVNHIKKDGRIFFEIGYNQAQQVSEILCYYKYTDIKVYKDYGGNDRVIIARSTL